MKSADEIIEQYSDLINRNPRIIMIIDPFNHNVNSPLLIPLYSVFF